jgi:hypothetical protein
VVAGRARDCCRVDLRTVQRIENEGTASLQSLKAIASALQVDLLDLKYIPESRMRKFEYKTVVLPFRMGIFKQGLPDIQTALNKEGQQGWRFTQMVLPSRLPVETQEALN